MSPFFLPSLPFSPFILVSLRFSSRNRTLNSVNSQRQKKRNENRTTARQLDLDIVRDFRAEILHRTGIRLPIDEIRAVEPDGKYVNVPRVVVSWNKRGTRSPLAFNEVRIHKRRLRTVAMKPILRYTRAVRRGYPACAPGSSIHRSGQQVYDRVMPSRKVSRGKRSLFNLTEIEIQSLWPSTHLHTYIRYVIPTHESAWSRPILLTQSYTYVRTCCTKHPWGRAGGD